MSRTATSRIALFVTLGLLALFFFLVVHLLGPDLIKKRNENAIWYFLHITGGSLVLALGPFQFIAPIRNRFRRYHRAAGYTYMVASLMAFAGIIGSLPLKFDLFFPSQVVALTLWVLVFCLPSAPFAQVKFLRINTIWRAALLGGVLSYRAPGGQHGMWLLTPSLHQNQRDWLIAIG